MDSLSVKRRLTCILAADAVGYSRHMAIDEEGTIRVLAAHRAVIDGIIAFHQGRIISTAGDSVLAEFASAVEAVRSAIEIQDAIRTRNDSLPEDRRMVFRVGVNLGDVVVKGDDILGDGVNVAARLESIAEPGGVCISSSVYDQITGKLDLGFQDIGEQALKNISRPIRVYRISGTAPPVRATPPPTRSARAPIVYAVIGTVVVLALVALLAWQAGWLRGGASDEKRVAASAPPPASLPSATAASPDADAKRAQAEADAVRIRADAEAMKRQAETDAAKIRAEADAQRAAKTKTDADAAAARTRAQAESDAARIRAEAERQAKSAVAQAPAAAPAAAPPAAATTPSAPMSAPALPAPKAITTQSASSAFDGDWNVAITCPAGESARGYRIEFPGRVKDGAMRAVRGVEGSPDSLRMEGDIKPDGSALPVAHGRTGDPKYSVGGVAASTQYNFTVKAQFEGTTGVGRRQELRPCEVRFTKQ